MLTTAETVEPQRFVVDLQPIGRRIAAEAGTSLLAVAQSAGVELVALCGGRGTCKSCRVRLAKGELSPATSIESKALSAEQLESGHRLACQARVQGGATIDIPPESLTAPQRLQIEGQDCGISLDPIVLPCDVELSPPSLDDLRADTVRVSDGLRAGGEAPSTFGLPVLHDLSSRLRQQGWRGRLAKRGSEIVAILPPGEPLLGLAVDVGTTKVAAYLVDLTSGRILAKAGAMNPQIGYGEDVVSRIVYASQGPEQQHELQVKIVEAVNDLIVRLCCESGARPEQVVEGVVVGNTAMHHLILGLPTLQLTTSPYVPAVSEAMDVRAQDLGVHMAPGAYVHLPPNIAGFVGGDHVAVILSTEISQTQQTVLALDIGTNTEISVAHRGRLYSCSCASGPAFEGAHIEDGMRAAPGAIERAQIVDCEVRIQTIGGQPPIGLCGSGILDAIAGMVGAGAVDASGRLQTGHPLVRARDGCRLEFVLVDAERTGHGRDIVVTQKDVREFQLAKAAIRVGVEILLGEAGLTADALEAFIVAGAFGSYVDVQSAMDVRMFPELPRDRFHQVGNAAGVGATQLLLSARHREIAAGLGQQVRYVELATHPRFFERFMDALYLRPVDLS